MHILAKDFGNTLVVQTEEGRFAIYDVARSIWFEVDAEEDDEDQEPDYIYAYDFNEKIP